MKLVHPEWEKQLEWKDGRFPLVVLENRTYHYQMAQALHDQILGAAGDFVLSEGESILDLGKLAEFIPSPWSMDFASRKIMTAFYTKAKRLGTGEDLFTPLREAEAAIQRYADSLDGAFPIPVVWDMDVDMVSLIKAIHLRPEDEAQTLAERMLAYMELCTELMGTACFIFCGFRGFLEEADLHALYHAAFLKKLRFLLIEQSCSHIMEEEDPFTVDEDLCQIFNE